MRNLAEGRFSWGGVRDSRPSLFVEPVYEQSGGKTLRSGVLAKADGLVAPHPFWQLLERLAVQATWLRATFGLASRPHCYGVARADGGSPVVGFCGTWPTAPRLTLLIAGAHLCPDEMWGEIRGCLRQYPLLGRFEDPFPPWQPGDRWAPVFWEEAC